MLDCKSFVIVASRVVVVAYFHSSTFPKGTKTGERERKKKRTPRRNRVPSKSLASIGPLSLFLFH
jgi:hypothetical protein